MKKLLSLLATVSLVSTSTASIVACGNENSDPIDDDYDYNYEEKDISTIISITDLGDINFYSFAGNDTQTQTEIINKIINLNPNVGDAQINISNITLRGTAVISVAGFNGSLTVTFTVVLVPVSVPLSFLSAPRSIIELQDGTILVAGGFTGAPSFIASIGLSNPANPQIQTLVHSLDAFPAAPNSMIELQDGTILAAGGTTANGSDSFIASIDLSDPDNPQIQILAQGPNAFPSMPRSIIELQDGTFLVAGGTDLSGSNSFLASIDLSDPANPQIQTLVQGSNAFPSILQSVIELQDGTILITGSGVVPVQSFLASVDLSDLDNPQIQTLIHGAPGIPFLGLIIQLDDGTILVGGGTVLSGANSFLASIDLSDPANPQIQTLVQGSNAFPATLSSFTQLQDGTILVTGGTNADGANSFLRMI